MYVGDDLTHRGGMLGSPQMLGEGEAQQLVKWLRSNDWFEA